MNEFCKRCRSTDIIEDEAMGHAVCINCGMVVSRVLISDAKEWRNFKEDDSAAQRDRINMVKMDNISDFSKYSCSSFSPKLDIMLNTTKEHTIKKLNELTNSIGNLLRLPKPVISNAHVLIKEYKASLQKTNQSRDALIVAALIVSSRQSGMALNIKEISKRVNLDTAKISKAQNRLLSVLQENKMKTKQCEINSPAAGYIRRYCFDLKIKPDDINKALLMCEVIESNRGLEGKRATSIASGIVGVINAHKSENILNITELNKITGVGGTTIMNTMKVVLGIITHIEDFKFSKEEIKAVNCWLDENSKRN